MLLKYDPDFICLQEFDPLYRNAENGLIDQITAQNPQNPQYTEVEIDGMTTADAKNKIYNPIFYDHSKYTQEASGYEWFKEVDELKDLSYEPVNNGETCYARSLVWAVLKDAEGDLFLVANTHFTMKTDITLEEKATIHTAEATFVANTLKGIADDYEDITVLVGGDMNSNVKNSPDCGVDKMLSNGFTHTYNLTANRNNSATSTNSNGGFDTGYLDYAIDHILTLNEDLNVRSFFVLTEMDRKVTGPNGTETRISDHLPVRMTFYK